MTDIYLIVGNKVRVAKARIVGNVAEVKTEYGVIEFGRYHLTEQDALEALQDRCARRTAKKVES